MARRYAPGERLPDGRMYISNLPVAPLPDGQGVVHNHFRPVGPNAPRHDYRDMANVPIGYQGFRVWIDDVPNGATRYEPCDCGWRADQLSLHWKVEGR